MINNWIDNERGRKLGFGYGRNDDSVKVKCIPKNPKRSWSWPNLIKVVVSGHDYDKFHNFIKFIYWNSWWYLYFFFSRNLISQPTFVEEFDRIVLHSPMICKGKVSIFPNKIFVWQIKIKKYIELLNHHKAKLTILRSLYISKVVY